MKAPGLILMTGMLLFLGGCSAAAVAALDNAMTSVNGDTCSFAKIFRGEAPCEDPETETTVVEEPLHCYRTLGVIDCYRAKDPFAKIEGRSPDEKQQVSSPGNSEVTGNNALLNSQRLPADSKPTILRRSTPLVLQDPPPVAPAAKKVEEPPLNPNPDEPFGPRKGKRPAIQS